jgi:Fe2+ or Zn2+ uptake regulation protein
MFRLEGAEAMICKIGDRYILVCDICGTEEDETFYDFYDTVEYKKENGWKSQKHQGEWEDVCPECQEV